MKMKNRFETNLTRLHAMKIYIIYLQQISAKYEPDSEWFMQELQRARSIVNSIQKRLNEE